MCRLYANTVAFYVRDLSIDMGIHRGSRINPLQVPRDNSTVPTKRLL